MIRYPVLVAFQTVDCGVVIHDLNNAGAELAADDDTCFCVVVRLPLEFHALAKKDL